MPILEDDLVFDGVVDVVAGHDDAVADHFFVAHAHAPAQDRRGRNQPARPVK